MGQKNIHMVGAFCIYLYVLKCRCTKYLVIFIVSASAQFVQISRVFINRTFFTHRLWISMQNKNFSLYVLEMKINMNHVNHPSNQAMDSGLFFLSRVAISSYDR